MSSLGYRGIVKIRVNKRSHIDSYVFHNSGTKQLGLILSKVLAGYTLSSQELPSKVDIRDRYTNTSVLLKPHDISSPRFIEQTTNSVLGQTEYAVLLRSTDVQSISGNVDLDIVLLDGSSRPLATVEDDNAGSLRLALSTMQTDVNQSIQINWTLQIVNVDV